MAKIDKETLDLIKRAIDIAESNDIENILFANKKIRGHSIEGGIFILQEVEKDFDFPPLALSRLSTLKKRLAVVENVADYEASCESDAGNTKVIKLLLKNKRTKIEFRCANPADFKSPVKVSDPIFYSFDMDNETVALLNRITASMGSDTVSFSGNKKDPNLLIKVKDSLGDSLEHTTESSITWMPECDKEEFNFVYSAKKISRLIRDAVSSNYKTVQLTKKGFLITPSKGIMVYTIAEV